MIRSKITHRYFIILIALTVSPLAQCQTLQVFYKAAQEARTAGNAEKFYDNILKAHDLHPYHQGILYQCGIAAALRGKNDEALKFLREAVQIKADFDLGIPELKTLSDLDGFKKLKTLQTELQQPILNSDTAFIIPERTYHIESIAPGQNGDFYFASIHRRTIVKRTANGVVSNFTQPGQDGLAAVFSVKVDRRNKVLWACSSPMEEMENYDSSAKSGVFSYAIPSGTLLKKYLPSTKKKKHVFGDLILSSRGKVFVSDSENNIIFVVNEQKGALDEFFTSDEFWNIQGIALSGDEKYLFVADYIKGVFRLELETRKLTLLTADFDLSLKSVDGLSFYKRSLIAVQNGVTPMRVTRYFLNADLTKLTHFKIIDRAHPAFNEPTNGYIVDDIYYYVANSLWSGYDDKRRLKPVEQLAPVVFLKVSLRD